ACPSLTTASDRHLKRSPGQQGLWRGAWSAGKGAGMGGKRRLYVVLAAALVAVGAASYALADQLDGPGKVPDSMEFKGTLNGFQETPSVSTTGFGEFRATLDEHAATPTIHFVFRYGGLEGGHSLFAHVHFGERGI